MSSGADALDVAVTPAVVRSLGLIATDTTSIRARGTTRSLLVPGIAKANDAAGAPQERSGVRVVLAESKTLIGGAPAHRVYGAASANLR